MALIQRRPMTECANNYVTNVLRGLLDYIPTIVVYFTGNVEHLPMRVEGTIKTMRAGIT